MSSLRRHEGYLLIDNRNSPGVPDEMLAKAGLPAEAGRSGGSFEAPIITCSHCHRGVVVNPARTRPRAYCPKCDHYICDWCEGERVRTGECRPMNQVLDVAQERAVKAAGSDDPAARLVLTDAP